MKYFKKMDTGNNFKTVGDLNMKSMDNLPIYIDYIGTLGH